MRPSRVCGDGGPLPVPGVWGVGEDVIYSAQCGVVSLGLVRVGVCPCPSFIGHWSQVACVHHIPVLSVVVRDGARGAFVISSVFCVECGVKVS